MNFVDKIDVYVGLIEDTRKKEYIKYSMNDIVFMIVCGMICGSKNIQEMVEILEYKIELIKKYINIDRIPCVATFSNILSMINPDKFELCMIGIMKNVLDIKRNMGLRKEISIDGKAIRSTDKMNDVEKCMQIVTALNVNSYCVEAQAKIEDKTNEIPIVQELLEYIDVKNSVVTMDAMHCQKLTAEKIIEKNGDYILQVKKNQKRLYEDIEAYFDEKLANKIDSEDYNIFSTIEKNGGRIEERKIMLLKDLEYILENFKDWKGLKNIFCIERKITKKDKESVEKSYYISSLKCNAEDLIQYTRNHWKIESYHWLLDVHYREDYSTVVNENTHENLNMARKLAIKIHKDYINRFKPKHKAIISSIRACNLSDNYMENIINSCTV